MTEKQIQEWIAYIERATGNPELAHIHEDNLRREFIQYIAEDYEGSLARKARLILVTEDIDFPRWTA